MTKEERAIREQALLTAALHFFTTEKWDDVSVAKIARRAGVAKGTVYLHFASKDEICARLAQDFYLKLNQKFRNTNGSGYQQLKQLSETCFTHYHQQKHYRPIVQYCRREHFLNNLNRELAQSLQQAAAGTCKQIATVIEIGVSDKSLVPNAGEKLTGICCTIEGALHHFSSDHFMQSNSHIEFINAVTSYILASVGLNADNTTTNDTHSNTLDLILEV